MTPNQFRDSLRGIIAFTPTPFSAHDRLAIDILAAHVDRLAQLGGPVAVCGAVGEFAALDLDEYRAAISTTVDAVSGRVPVIVGVGLGTRIASDLAAHAARAGASGLLVNPLGGDVTDDGLVRHYRSLAAASGLGLIVFSTRGQVYSVEQLTRLADIDEVVALKDEWGDLRLFAEARERLGARFAWIDGMAELQAAEYVILGADAMTSGLVNVAPDLTMAIWAAATESRWDDLRGLVARARPFAALRARQPGYSIAVIKAALALLGHSFGDVRPPLSPLTPADMDDLRVVLADLMPLGAA